MKIKVLFSVIAAAIVLCVPSVASAASARDVALAFEQKQVLDGKVRATLAAPEKEMQAVCGRTSGDAYRWALAFAERSFFALSEKTSATGAGNHFMEELASAYYGRSKIYYAAQFHYMRERERYGRLRGNDKRIEGVMRAARRAIGPATIAGDSIRQQAQETVAALIEQNKACN